jgi:intein-encoded DNA endonuclease-like protein
VIFVGNSRTDGCGTDDPKDDGFILVKTKKDRRKGTVSWAEVVKAPAEMRGQDVSKNKIVSGSLSRNNPVNVNEV